MGLELHACFSESMVIPATPQFLRDDFATLQRGVLGRRHTETRSTNIAAQRSVAAQVPVPIGFALRQVRNAQISERHNG
jgi:hypothetical protein